MESNNVGNFQGKFIRISKFFITWVAMTIFCTISFSPVSASVQESPFAPVKNLLIRDGFDPSEIEQLFSDPRVEPAFKSVSLFFIHSEARLNYFQFTTQESIRKAQNYIDKHHDTLVMAEKKYGVDKNVITGILLVETRLGTYTGSSPILNTLATMASLKDPDRRETLFQNITNPNRLSRETFEKQADRRWNWAYDQLKAFLQYTERENIDPLSISGSYAGALGIAQFLPTSILAYARDGNGDDRIDLFDHADAIASVANYLKTFGWKPGISREKAEKAVFAYNRSSYYVNTILTIADLLGKQEI
jgi:membrane-bound lytic murein transglycosylase B